MRCPQLQNPQYPQQKVAVREYKPFESTKEVRVVGSDRYGDMRAVYTSPAIHLNGYTQYEVYASVHIRTDTGLVNQALGIVGVLNQSNGSVNNPVAHDIILRGNIFDLPAINTPVKVYTGHGRYRLNLCQSGSLQTPIGLSGNTSWSLLMGGTERILQIHVSGVVVAGEGFAKYRKHD